MGVSSLFIRRPIATSLLMVALLLFGIFGYRSLPVAALPNVEAPSLQVTTQYPGANPSTMARLVTTPLERQFGQISGLTLMSSNSSQGLSVILLQFAQNQNIENAAQDVQAAINAARGTLPSALPYPPVYSKVNPADAPILTLALTSDTLPVREVANYADSTLAQKLSQISGVGLVSIAGNLKPAVRIEVNPAALANLGLTLEDVRSAITQANVNAPKGSLNGSEQSFTIGADDQLPDAAAYRNLIISYQNGAPVHLSDVATVDNGVENDQVAAWANGKPAVLLDIRRQPGANIVQTVAAIRAELPSLHAVLPAGVNLKVFSDRTETIRASVRDVKFTLFLAIVLVVLVIFVFLRRLWATVIPSVAMPLSLIGTFGVMTFAGFSLDNLSLMALTVATGFVVDDAIVMIENIVRYIEQGKHPREAAQIGAHEIGFTIISLTVSLIAVFLPLLLMPGVTGLLFHEFAWVLSIAVAISAVISLTLTPMLCAYLLKPGALPADDQAPAQSHRKWWTRTLAVYERSLDWVFAHQRTMIGLFALSLAVTVILYIVIPKGLLPEQDTGLITGVVEASQSIAFPAMERRVEAVADALRRDPDVAGVSGFVGIGDINPTLNQGQLSIVLKSRSERGGLAPVLQRLQQAASNIPGVALYLKPVQDVTLDTRVAATQYQYVLRSLDTQALDNYAARMNTAFLKLPELSDVANNLTDSGRELNLQIDRASASRLGVPIQTINDTLYDAFGQRQISTIFTELNQYRVILEVAPQYRNTTSLLNQLTVRSNGSGALTGSNASSFGQVVSSNTSTATGIGRSNTGINVGGGSTVPLSALVQPSQTSAPLVVSHLDQMPAVMLSFNLAPGYSLSQAENAIGRVQRQMNLPASVRAGFVGSAAEFSASLNQEVLLILASILIIYIVLGVLYESYIHPLTILSTLPSAGVGALLFLRLGGHDLDVIGIIAIILLIGIVKKNGIMIVDVALKLEREEGMGPEEAVVAASHQRLRPILMTTACAFLGGVPMILGNGTGSEFRQPLGWAICGGLLVSRVLTLFSTPVVYYYLDKVRRKI
ncbi:MAG: efflux RND transporter permease subunit, partial [Gammaproteobacteria bacterium]